MDDIYNTIALDGINTGKTTAATGARVYVPATDKTIITSYLIKELYPTQASTPSPTSRVNIASFGFIFYHRATSASDAGTGYSVPLTGITDFYGSAIDIVKGVIYDDVTRVYLKDLTWASIGTDGSTKRYRARLYDIDAARIGADTCRCTHLVYNSSSSQAWGYFYLDGSYVYVNDKDSNFSTVTEFTTWLSSRGSGSSSVFITYPNTSGAVRNFTGTTIPIVSGRNYYFSATSQNVTASVLGVSTITSVEPYLVLKRPSDFEISREDIYAGEYTTCTGAVKADRIGWKYSDTTISIDEMAPDDLQILAGMGGELIFYFDDVDGPQEEHVIKQGFSNTPTRLTLPDGRTIWKDIQFTVRFINAHN